MQPVARRIFQFWLLPKANDTAPSYEQRSISQMNTANQLMLLVFTDDRNNVLSINQDASLNRLTLSESLTEIPIDESRCQFF